MRKKEPKRLRNSFKYAFKGISTGLKQERNMKIHLAMTILVVFCGIFFKISQTEWSVCIILCGLVWAAELINTAIESVVDICSPNYQEKTKTAKDTAAGAVLVLAIVSAIVGFIIFFPKFLYLFK